MHETPCGLLSMSMLELMFLSSIHKILFLASIEKWKTSNTNRLKQCLRLKKGRETNSQELPSSLHERNGGIEDKRTSKEEKGI